MSPGEVRFVATSATIGDDNNDDDKLRKFLADIAGTPPERVALIKGERAVPPLSTTSPKMALPDPHRLVHMSPEEAYSCLAASEPMRRLRHAMTREPVRLADAVARLGRDSDSGAQPDSSQVLSLLEQAAGAQHNDDRFMPLRVHLFHRAQSGIWACINPYCSGRYGTSLDTAEWPYGRAFTHEIERCTACGSLALELVRCSQCGEPFLTGEETEDGILQPVREVSERDEFAQDVEPADDAVDLIGVRDGSTATLASRRLVARSGSPGTETIWIDSGTGKILDGPNATVLKMGLSAGSSQCLACDAVDHASDGKLFRNARFGAPSLLGNLVPELLEFVPRRPRDDGDLPAEGRQLLTFTDSRQGTARFAAKLQQDSERNFVRSAVYHIIQAAATEAAPSEHIARLENELETLRPLQDVPAIRDLYDQKAKELSELRGTPAALGWREVRRYLADRDDLRIWMRDLWEDRDTGFADPLRLAELQMFREFLRRPRLQNSAETMGLASLHFDEIDRPDEHSIPEPFIEHNAKLEDWQDFLYLVLSFFVRSYSAVSIDRSLLRWIGRRIPPRRITGPGVEAVRDEHEVAWPQATSAARTGRILRLLALGLGLDLDQPADRDRANECLSAAWDVLVRLRDVQQPHFQLDLTRARIAPLCSVWICPITRTALDRTFFGYTPYFPLGGPTTAAKCERINMPKLPFPWRQRNGEEIPSREVREWLAIDEVVKTARAKGVWTNLHDRIAAVAPFVRSAEHSAQQSADRLSGYEAAFKQGKINVLCCSTTMEMGVDIGGISSVIMTNVPPAPTNYRQRVGRAGRRGEDIALALTFCKDDPLGWTVFRDPRWPFLTTIRPPTVSLDSPVIVQRHINALLLAFFLRCGVDYRASDIPQLESGWFFKRPETGRGEKIAPCDTFAAWCESAAGLPPQVAADLSALVAGTCLEGRADLQAETADATRNASEDWRREWEALTEDLTSLPAGDQAAQRALRIALQRIEGNYLLTELATRGFLPSYGFPTDVVAFYNTTISDIKRRGEEKQRPDNRFTNRNYPSRQLDIAIRDYAPGTDVVVDGLVYRSGGITLNWKRLAAENAPPEVQALGFAWRCAECGTADTSSLFPEVCDVCGAANIKPMPFLRPAGFTVDIREEPHTDTAEVNFVSAPQPWISARGGEWVPLPNADVGRYRVSRLGHVFHYARGADGHGYALCLQCGRAAAEEAPPGIQTALPNALVAHKPLRRASQLRDGLCPGNSGGFSIRRNLALGHSITTDILELQLSGLSDAVVATTIAVAAREALARQLGIENAEIGWAIVRTRGEGRQDCHSIFLYDYASGGAGFSSSAGNFIPDILADATQILNCTNPDCTTACHACVLVNDTRFDVDRLDRRAALQFLHEHILHRLSLPPEYAYFATTSRAESRPLAEAIDKEMTLRTDAGLKLWVDGLPAEWDFTSWPALPVLEKWGAKGRRVALAVEQQVLAMLTFGQRVTLRSVIERSRAVLISATSLPRAGEGYLIGELRSASGVTGWASDTARARVPGDEWGRGLSAALVTGSADLSSGVAERSVGLDDLFPADAVRGDMLRILDEANGSANEFGARFWGFVLEKKPEIGQLIRRGDVVRVVYQDRYLFSPIAVRLLRELLRPLAQGADRPELLIRTLDHRAGGGSLPPAFLWHDWQSSDHRNHVLRTLVEGIGFKSTLETSTLQQLPHERTIEIHWRDQGSVILHLDQGLGHWTAVGRPRFAFTAGPQNQALSLAALRFELVHRQPYPMAIFVLDAKTR
jgi:hypothetical protein